MKNRISMALKDPILQQGFEIICKNLVELEIENAELKETIRHFNPCGDWDNDVHDCEFRHYAMEYGSRLVKAKEIMQKLCDIVCGRSGDDWELIKQAEQFLREVK